ncbi:MAG: hypothetical protein ACRCZ2_04335 [Fusobacteriaceae bacterium]
MSRKKLRNYDDKEDIKNLTIRERALSKLFGLIFHLNNNQIRYCMEYRGYEFILSKYNFSKKEYEIVECHNFTQMEYNESYRIIRTINKRLYDELLSKVETDYEWEED